MGSGNSVPVDRAREVETEAHQDFLEMRFDHLAVGSTAVVVLFVLLLLYWCGKRRRSKQRARRGCRTCGNANNLNLPWTQMTPMMMPPMMMPQMMQPRPIEMMPIHMPAATSPIRYEDRRFTEVYEEPSRTAAASTPPARPPLPEPVPRLAAENNKPAKNTERYNAS